MCAGGSCVWAGGVLYVRGAGARVSVARVVAYSPAARTNVCVCVPPLGRSGEGYVRGGGSCVWAGGVLYVRGAGARVSVAGVVAYSPEARTNVNPWGSAGRLRLCTAGHVRDRKVERAYAG